MRRNEVLAAMRDQDYISPTRATGRRATAGSASTRATSTRSIRDPFLFDLVQQELIDKYGFNTVRNGGLKAYTTIDPELQERAEEAVEGCYECYPEGGPVAGLASVNPENGEIVALASTKGFADEKEFNYAWQAQRQPGSSFKTYVLTTAIKQGIDPRTTYYDGTSPITLQLPGGGTWTVHNAEEGGGVMSLEAATWASVNVVFAQLDLDVGPENVTHTAHQMGIEANLESVPAEAIGGLREGVTPLEMADGYATLADGGVHHDPTAISKVEFPDGKVDEPDADEGDRVLTEGQAYEVTKVLEGVITGGTGTPTYMGCTGGGRQDRDLGGALRRLVRRLHAALLDRGLGRPPEVARRNRLRRPDRGADLAVLHGSGGGRRTAPNSKSPRACPNSTASRATTRAPRPKSRRRTKNPKKNRTKSPRRTKKRNRKKKAATKAGRPNSTKRPKPTPDPDADPDTAAGPPGAHRRRRRRRRTALIRACLDARSTGSHR